MVKFKEGGVMRKGGILSMVLLLFLSSSQPSWAWRGGWGLFGLGVVTGAVAAGAWGPYGCYPYNGYGPYNPYCYPYYDYPPYAYPPAAGAPRAAPVPRDPSPATDNSPRSLKRVKDQLSRMHELLDFKYEDGDISKADRNAGFRYLDEIAKLARSEYDANGKSLTARQESDLLLQIQNANPVNHRPGEPYPEVMATPAEAPEPSAPTAATSAASTGYVPHDLPAINDLLLELRTLLDVKLKSGDITKAQHDAEGAYLDRIEQEAHSGSLTEDKENELVHQLHKAYYSINHNLVSQ
jgi:hypothetical protein